MFKSLFSKSTKQSTDNNIQCLEKMRSTLDLINSKSKQLEKQITNSHDTAKKYAKQGDKKSAMLALKKKTLYTKNLEKLEGQRLNLEMQIINIETMGINKEIINSMKSGNDLMKSFQKENAVENIDDIVDDIQENMDKFNEITDALSTPLVQMDEDELESELFGLESEALEKDLLTVNMPSVPSTEPVTETPKSSSIIKHNMTVEEELDLLKQELAL